MFKNLFLPLIAVAVFIGLVGLLMQGKLGRLNLNSNQPQNSVESTPEQENIVDTKIIKVGNKQITVEVARTDTERSVGLSGRNSLEANSGMIFVFNPSAKPNFWMKDTLIPLDMIWISQGKVIGITKNVQPQPGAPDHQLTLYPAPSEVDYVLEVNGGFSDYNSIKVGDRVETNF